MDRDGRLPGLEEFLIPGMVAISSTSNIHRKSETTVTAGADHPLLKMMNASQAAN